MRSCELHAIAIQDRVLLGGRYADRDYAARREGAFLVAVNCFEPGGTCFCVSMGTGPKADAGYDLALTEILDGEHRFLRRGRQRARRGGRSPSCRGARRRRDDLEAAGAAVDGAARSDGPARSTRPTSATCSRRNLEHPRWDDVAERCLTCGNCTMVCPTCFCTSVEDTTDLAGDEAERVRVWDSCFSVDYSYIHGGSDPALAAARATASG